MSQDQTLSVQDPGMRHGIKSVTKRFECFKVAVAADRDLQLLSGMDKLSANPVDSQRVRDSEEASEENTSIQVEAMIAGCFLEHGTRC